MIAKSWFVFARSLIPALLVGSLALAPASAAAALKVVTPGEQNTQSGENGCNVGAACGAGHWLHYPEILQNMLGAGYVVTNNGDGGAVLGCDAATATVAGGGSFCKSGTYTSSVATTPDIVIIGPFGEHDQRIVGASGANTTALYMQSVFEGAYEGLVQKYLKGTTKIYMMTPIDVPWGGTPNLPAGDDLVKNIMLPAAMKVATAHQIPIIDTYTAISGTTALATMYYAVDGQVTAAAQQKMASLILAALMSGGTGGAGGGGAGGAGGAGGGGGAGTAGAGGAGGVGTAGAGGSTAGTAGAGGTAGTTTGTAGAGGSTSTTGTAGVTGAGSAGMSGGTAGTSGASGTGGGTTGTAGAQGTAGTGTSTVPPRQGSSGGCATAAPSPAGALGLAALAMLAAVVVGRRRSRRH
jgi:MYXO-CTERM domain-containing protein